LDPIGQSSTGTFFTAPTKHRNMKQKYEAKDLQALVDVGREQGYLTFKQVNSFLPQDII